MSHGLHKGETRVRARLVKRTIWIEYVASALLRKSGHHLHALVTYGFSYCR